MGKASGGPAGGRTFEKFDKQVGRAKSKSWFSHRWHGWAQIKTGDGGRVKRSWFFVLGSWFEGFALLMGIKEGGKANAILEAQPLKSNRSVRRNANVIHSSLTETIDSVNEEQLFIT